jgi:hypothetical protein
VVTPEHGPRTGDWTEIRMNVTDMVSALAARTNAHSNTLVAYCKAWLDVGKDFRNDAGGKPGFTLIPDSAFLNVSRDS